MHKCTKIIAVSFILIFSLSCKSWAGNDDKEYLNQKKAAEYNNRGAAYASAKDFVRAISDFSSAIDIDPKCAEAHYNRGGIYYKIGSLDKAIADFDKAIQINPGYARAYNARAIAFFYKQEYAKADADVRKAQELGYDVHPGFLEALKRARTGS